MVHQSASGRPERAFSLGREEEQTLQLLSSWLLHGAPRHIHLCGHLHPDSLRFFGTLHTSIAITKPSSIYIGLVRSAMATVARTMSQLKSKRPSFLNSRLEFTSLVARSAASQMLGYTCELEIKHYHRTFPSTHAHYNSYRYSLLVPSSTLPKGGLRPKECRPNSPKIIHQRLF